MWLQQAGWRKPVEDGPVSEDPKVLACTTATAGVQYACGDDRDLLSDHGIVASMSRAGNC